MTEQQTSTVPAASATIFEEIRAKWGHVPPAYEILGPNPRLLAARWRYQSELMKPSGPVDALLKESIALAVSATNGCGFCVFAHSLGAKRHGADEAEIARIRNGSSADPRRAEVLQAVVALTKDPHALEGAGLERLRVLGYSEADLLEIIEVAAFFNGFNRLLDSYGVAPPAAPPQ